MEIYTKVNSGVANGVTNPCFVWGHPVYCNNALKKLCGNVIKCRAVEVSEVLDG